MKKYKWEIIGLIIVILMSLLLLGIEIAKADNIKDDFNVKIVNCIDADTLEVLDDGEIYTIRVLYLDAFETRNNKQAKRQAEKLGISVEEVIKRGQQAKAYCQYNMVGKDVYLLKLNNLKCDKDRYGRKLRAVRLLNRDNYLIGYEEIFIDKQMAIHVNPYC